MVRFRQRNTSWLILLGILIGTALIAGTANTGAAVALVTLFLIAAVASLVELDRQPAVLANAMQRAVRTQATPQAKEASERARRRGSYIDTRLTLLDIGLIAAQSNPEGMVMRRARSISKDDDGVRPFITINVDPQESERSALVRFEIVDQTGQEQYVYEMKTYLRAGEMNLLADHHLRLANNSNITGMGDWDLRVYIDGTLMALHNFMLAPSVSERARRLSPNADQDDQRYMIAEPEDEEVPMSLEQLLRNQSRNRRN